MFDVVTIRVALLTCVFLLSSINEAGADDSVYLVPQNNSFIVTVSSTTSSAGIELRRLKGVLSTSSPASSSSSSSSSKTSGYFMLTHCAAFTNSYVAKDPFVEILDGFSGGSISSIHSGWVLQQQWVLPSEFVLRIDYDAVPVGSFFSLTVTFFPQTILTRNSISVSFSTEKTQLSGQFDFPFPLSAIGCNRTLWVEQEMLSKLSILRNGSLFFNTLESATTILFGCPNATSRNGESETVVLAPPPWSNRTATVIMYSDLDGDGFYPPGDETMCSWRVACPPLTNALIIEHASGFGYGASGSGDVRYSSDGVFLVEFSNPYRGVLQGALLMARCFHSRTHTQGQSLSASINFPSSTMKALVTTTPSFSNSDLQSVRATSCIDGSNTTRTTSVVGDGGTPALRTFWNSTVVFDRSSSQMAGCTIKLNMSHALSLCGGESNTAAFNLYMTSAAALGLNWTSVLNFTAELSSSSTSFPRMQLLSMVVKDLVQLASSSTSPSLTSSVGSTWWSGFFTFNTSTRHLSVTASASGAGSSLLLTAGDQLQLRMFLVTSNPESSPVDLSLPKSIVDSPPALRVSGVVDVVCNSPATVTTTNSSTSLLPASSGGSSSSAVHTLLPQATTTLSPVSSCPQPLCSVAPTAAASPLLSNSTIITSMNTAVMFQWNVSLPINSCFSAAQSVCLLRLPSCATGNMTVNSSTNLDGNVSGLGVGGCSMNARLWFQIAIYAGSRLLDLTSCESVAGGTTSDERPFRLKTNSSQPVSLYFSAVMPTSPVTLSPAQQPPLAAFAAGVLSLSCVGSTVPVTNAAETESSSFPISTGAAAVAAVSLVIILIPAIFLRRKCVQNNRRERARSQQQEEVAQRERLKRASSPLLAIPPPPMPVRPQGPILNQGIDTWLRHADEVVADFQRQQQTLLILESDDEEELSLL